VNPTDSRIPGFYRLTLSERQELIASRAQTSAEHLKQLLNAGGLTPEVADKTVENVIGTYALPFGLGLNFRVNDVDRIVPMVVEEPSVIAAASNAARLARMSGGFFATMLGTQMTGQIEIREVENASESIRLLNLARAQLLELANAAAPGLVSRGGGAQDLDVRDLSHGILVVHIHVDCKDAMGANLINGIAEAIGPEIARIAQGRLGLRILTNLCDRRRVQAECRIAVSHLADSKESSSANLDSIAEGRNIAIAIEAASRFASIDPYRAVTHNKGIMNGVDSVVLATGNDFRAVEAAAHAWAAISGQYRPLARWQVKDDYLTGRLEMPLALGTVGGTLRVHPTAQWALALLDVKSASELCEIAACVGLASNLSAIRALATEGIQRGHMSLHARSVAVTAGARPEEVEPLARRLVEGGRINETTALSLLAVMREGAPKGQQ
jgi:hydroxymethylglutaryl-CoA reductase